MWSEPEARRAVEEALSTALERPGCGEAFVEVLLKRSRGSAARARRASASTEECWSEHALAVRVVRPDGRRGLAVAPDWRRPRRAAAAAAELAAAARPSPVPAGEVGALSAAPHLARGAPWDEPPPADELSARVTLFEEAVRAGDERVVGADVVEVRAAVVDSILATSDGTAFEQRQAAWQASASLTVREGPRLAGHSDGRAGGRLGEGELEAFASHLVETAVLQLAGVAATPPAPAAVLGAAALAEITHALAPSLATSRPRARRLGAGHQSLALAEDSGEDELARRWALDATGRPLRRVSLLDAEALRAPGADAMPRVRAGAGDPPAPGWLRLSWTWAGEPLDDEGLRERLETGLEVVSARTVATEPEGPGWRGLAAGWWVERGRRRWPVARLPVRLALPDLVSGARAAGRPSAVAHASGTVRALPLLLERLAVELA